MGARGAFCLTDKNLPEVSSRWCNLKIIAFPPAVPCQPVVLPVNKRRVIIQFTPLNPFMAPFTNIKLTIFIAPSGALPCKVRIVSLHTYKRSTGRWKGIRFSGEVLDYSFSSAVSDGSHVKGTSMWFTAVEPHLSKRQFFPQFTEGGICEQQVVAFEAIDLAV